MSMTFPCEYFKLYWYFTLFYFLRWKVQGFAEVLTPSIRCVVCWFLLCSGGCGGVAVQGQGQAEARWRLLVRDPRPGHVGPPGYCLYVCVMEGTGSLNVSPQKYADSAYSSVLG